MPAFEKLVALGEPKFAKIRNSLMTGTPAMALARIIRVEWGDLPDVAEKTLTQQLSRLRIRIAQGAFGAEAQAILEDSSALTLKFLKGTSLQVLQELTALAGMQERRLQFLWDQERKTAKYNVHINLTVEHYKELLLDIQKLRFDLGLDEFKGIVPGIKGKVERVDLPDGSSAQRLMFDIVSNTEDILQRRLGA